MSFNTISRWNAISLERPREETNKKRPRSVNEQDDDDDDDVSLVSRSPSPQPMDVDVNTDNVHLYDEHRDVRGVAREVITAETKIKSTNKGFAMLAKMGWTEGQPLGLSGEGRTEPVPFTVKQDSTGLGKVTQEIKMIETTVSQRRGLDSERMQRETEEQRKIRESNVAQKAAVQSEISSVLKPFYCEVCQKQFQNVAQYDEHTNSYGHHHRVRLRDMQVNNVLRQGGKEEVERRKDKERKREEKELRKIAKAAGIKISAPSPSSTISMASSSTLPKPVDEQTPPKKAGGWTKITSETVSVFSGTVAPAADAASTSIPTRAKGGWSSIETRHPLPPLSNATSFDGQNLDLRASGSWSTIGSTSTPNNMTTGTGQPSTTPQPHSAPQTTQLSKSGEQARGEPQKQPLGKVADQSRGSWQQFQSKRGAGLR